MLRSLIDRIELRRAGDGQGMAAILYGELASILSLCSESGRKKNSPKLLLRGVNCRWLRGLEATYTELNSITSEKSENRSKSWARNRLDLQLRDLLETTIA